MLDESEEVKVCCNKQLVSPRRTSNLKDNLVKAKLKDCLLSMQPISLSSLRAYGLVDGNRFDCCVVGKNAKLILGLIRDSFDVVYLFNSKVCGMQYVSSKFSPVMAIISCFPVLCDSMMALRSIEISGSIETQSITLKNLALFRPKLCNS